MERNKIQLTSAEAGEHYHSDIKVYDAKTGQLKRVESSIGKVLMVYGDNKKATRRAIVNVGQS